MFNISLGVWSFVWGAKSTKDPLGNGSESVHITSKTAQDELGGLPLGTKILEVNRGAVPQSITYDLF